MKYQYDYKVKLNWQDSSTVEGSDKDDAYKRAYGIIRYAIEHDILDVKDLLDVEITKFEPTERYINCAYCNTPIIQKIGVGRKKVTCSDSCRTLKARSRRKNNQ